MYISYWAIIYILYYIFILHEISKREANWIGHILRRNCLLQRVIEGKIQGEIEVTGRQRKRRRKLLDDLKERRGYFRLKEEALNRAMWRARFERGFGPVVRQTTKCMNELYYYYYYLHSFTSFTVNICTVIALLHIWENLIRHWRFFFSK
jgi:hypothetical protein